MHTNLQKIRKAETTYQNCTKYFEICYEKYRKKMFHKCSGKKSKKCAKLYAEQNECPEKCSKMCAKR